MAIAGANLTASGSTTDATSYATASVTPTADALVLASVVSTGPDNTTPNTPTCTGNGLTWVQVASNLFDDAGTVRARLTLFRAMGGSPSAGALTFDFGGQAQVRAAWTVSERTGVDTGGTNGSAAVVQNATGAGNSASGLATLAAFADATNNEAYGVFGVENADARTPGAGFTILGETTVTETFQLGIADEQQLGEDTSVDMSWTGSNPWGAIAVEVAAEAGGPISQEIPVADLLLDAQTVQLLQDLPLSSVLLDAGGPLGVGQSLPRSDLLLDVGFIDPFDPITQEPTVSAIVLDTIALTPVVGGGTSVPLPIVRMELDALAIGLGIKPLQEQTYVTYKSAGLREDLRPGHTRTDHKRRVTMLQWRKGKGDIEGR